MSARAWDPYSGPPSNDPVERRDALRGCDHADARDDRPDRAELRALARDLRAVAAP